MRGYGVAVVSGATRAVAAGSGAVVGGVSWVKQRLGGDEDAETQQDDVEVAWKPKAKLGRSEKIQVEYIIAARVLLFGLLVQFAIH